MRPGEELGTPAVTRSGNGQGKAGLRGAFQAEGWSCVCKGPGAGWACWVPVRREHATGSPKKAEQWGTYGQSPGASLGVWMGVWRPQCLPGAPLVGMGSLGTDPDGLAEGGGRIEGMGFRETQEVGLRAWGQLHGGGGRGSRRMKDGSPLPAHASWVGVGPRVAAVSMSSCGSSRGVWEAAAGGLGSGQGQRRR